MKVGFLKRRWITPLAHIVMENNGPQSIITRTFAKAKVQAAEAPLVDGHGRVHTYLRVSLTERCNLRCTYCMPAGGVPLSPRADLLTLAELARLLRAFAAAGVTKVRLTGGEPALRPDLEEAVAAAAAAPGVRAVGLTTNGVALARRLPALRAAGLTHLNVSLDTLRAERWERLTRRPPAAHARVLRTVHAALDLGFSPVKINVVLLKGVNDDEVADFVELTRELDVEVRFIEFMPFTGNAWDEGALVAARDALRAAAAAHELRPAAARAHDTARLWAAPGYRGAVGFVASVTRPFCASCNRVRLTADGRVKACLFGAAELSLRDELRAGADDARLMAVARAALAGKRAQHAGERAARPRRARAPRAQPPRCRRARARALDRQPADGADRRLGALSHVDGAGRARMVDVGDKPVTRRAAVAECRVRVNARVLRLLRAGGGPKGDALCVARVAGALAAKRAADLIPLCHPLPLSAALVDLELPEGDAAGGDVRVRCEVRVEARTGAEMEALTGCAVAALTLYDMCKAVDRAMTVSELRVVHKEGGRGGPSPRPA